MSRDSLTKWQEVNCLHPERRHLLYELVNSKWKDNKLVVISLNVMAVHRLDHVCSGVPNEYILVNEELRNEELALTSKRPLEAHPADEEDFGGGFELPFADSVESLVQLAN